MREALGVALALLGLMLIGGVLLAQWALRRRSAPPTAHLGGLRFGDETQTQTRPMHAVRGPVDETATRRLATPSAAGEQTATRPMALGEGPLHVKSTAPAPGSLPPEAAPALPPMSIADLPSVHDDDRHDITMVTLRSHVEREARGLLPARDGDADDDDDVAAATLTHPILFDEEAAGDELTGPIDVFLISAACSTDPGRVRRRNEDAHLALDAAALYVVADGMGGYAGGDVASRLAVEGLERVFAAPPIPENRWPGLPRRAAELASAIDQSNTAVFERSREEPRLRGMGTTLVAARFSPKKERLYIGHVGDSRCYRLRGGKLVAMTQDHTLASIGVGGPAAGRLVRAIGIQKHVEIDLVIAKPRPGDLYLLCSDGLTKMASEDEVAATLDGERDLGRAAERLVDLAIEHGGKDNVTVVVVRVERAKSA